MSSNTLCLRIFFVLFILIVGASMVFLYALRVVTPLAVCLLPTVTTQAQFTKDFSFVLSQTNSNSQLFRSEIAYSGHETTLLTTMPPIPFGELEKAAARRNVNRAEIDSGLRPTNWDQSLKPVLTVRYVRAFPSLVVRDIPGGSIWSYYADTWPTWDFPTFFFWTVLLIVVIICFYRHLRNSRRRHYR